MPRTVFDAFALATMNPATGQMNPSGTTQALAYTYDAKNRLARAQVGANAADFVTYRINALGQRVQKTGAGIYAYSTTATIDAATGNSPLARSLNFNARYVYDESGRLIGEYAPDGKLISETIYFNDLPIATLRPKGANAGTPLGIAGTTTGNPANGATAANANNVGNNSTTNRVNVEVFYVHPDHLGTPRVVTRSTIATGANAPSSATPTSPGAINKAVWRHDSDPFGTSLSNSAPVENPQLITGTATDQRAASFVQSLGFAGQIQDAETGKRYNNFRDYDTAIARYTKSDPIGLKAGLATYAYVDNDPITKTDFSGLASNTDRYHRWVENLCPTRVALSSHADVDASGPWSYKKNNSPHNAVLHCHGTCRADRECGVVWRTIAATGHELLDFDKNGPFFPFYRDFWDTYNDVLNNWHGALCARKRECGRNLVDCLKCCLEKLQNGNLFFDRRAYDLN